MDGGESADTLTSLTLHLLVYCPLNCSLSLWDPLPSLYLSLLPSSISISTLLHLLLPPPPLSLSVYFCTSCFSLLFLTTFDRFECIFGSVDSIRRDIKEMREKLNEFEPQIGFCHNDLSHANIIYNKEEGIL